MKALKSSLPLLVVLSMLFLVPASSAQSRTITMWQEDDEFGECVADYVTQSFPNPEIQVEVPFIRK
jgi:hypothetical protein